MIEEENQFNTIDHFVSDDGNHEIEWLRWNDKETKSVYPTWVCTTHNKLYYTDCIYNAQTE